LLFEPRNSTPQSTPKTITLLRVGHLFCPDLFADWYSTFPIPRQRQAHRILLLPLFPLYSSLFFQSPPITFREGNTCHCTPPRAPGLSTPPPIFYPPFESGPTPPLANHLWRHRAGSTACCLPPGFFLNHIPPLSFFFCSLRPLFLFPL